MNNLTLLGVSMPSRAFFLPTQVAMERRDRHAELSQCPHGHLLFLHQRNRPDISGMRHVSMPSRAFVVPPPVGEWVYAEPGGGLNALTGICCSSTNIYVNTEGALVLSQCPHGHLLFLHNYTVTVGPGCQYQVSMPSRAFVVPPPPTRRLS